MIKKLLQFLDINDDTRRLGSDLWEVLAPSIEPVLSEFYRKVQLAGFEPHLSDAEVERLKQKQKTHWESLFRSRFDERYLASVQRIGIRHRDVGLDLSVYIAGYGALKIEFVSIIVQSGLPVLAKGLLIKTLDKYVAFDMALSLSAYGVVIVD